jgi:alkylhydroperoxidase/carboxymuconolactone decarboxylase family protein YurZ
MRARCRSDPMERAVNRHEQTLCKLSIRDNRYVDGLLMDDDANLAASSLDPKTHALVRLAGLAAIDAAPPSYMEVIELARRYAASDDEIVGVLIAVMPAVGGARVVSAAPKLSLALGFDVGAARAA